MTEEETNALKTKFAELFLKDGADKDKAFSITMGLFDNTGDALKAAQYWPVDDFVLSEMSRIIGSKEDGNLSFLPDKAASAKLAWDIAAGNGIWAETSDRIKALELYNKIRGFMAEKAAVQVNVVNRIMKVRDHGSDEQWQERVRRQQERLTNEVSSSANDKPVTTH